MNSPSERGSLQGDAQSGRLTPLNRVNQAPVAPMKMLRAQSKQDVTMGDAADDATTNQTPIVELLLKFSSHVAIQGALQISRDQAEAHVQLAQQEYNANRKTYEGYPAIKDRKTADEIAAKKDLVSKDGKLKEHMSSGHTLMNDLLAALIGGVTAEIKPQIESSAQRTDAVSRADHQKLQTSYSELKEEVDTLKAGLAEAKRLADTASSEYVGLKKEVVKSSKLEARIQDAQNVAETACKNVNVLKSDAASKELVNKLGSNYENLAQKVGGIEKKNLTLSKDMSQLKAAKVADKISQPSANPAIAPASAVDAEFKAKVERLSTDGPALGKTVEKLQQRVVDLHSATIGPEGEDMGSSLDSDSSLSKMLYQFREEYAQTKRKLESLDWVPPFIKEEGKDSVVKRLKNLDIVVNNVASEVRSDGKAPVLLRLSQLEQDQDALQKDLKDITSRGQHQLVSQAGSSLDLEPYCKRLDTLARDLEGFKSEQDAKDQLVEEGVRELLEPVRQEMKDSCGQASRGGEQSQL